MATTKGKEKRITMLFGITGTDGAGKGTVVKYLVEEKGFVHYSARSLLIEELNRRGEELTRFNMLTVANEFREKYGSDFLVTQYLKRIKKEEPKKAIIESIRSVGEAETLKKNSGILIAVDADQVVRYERVQKRRSETDKVSFEEFVKNEAAELDDPRPFGAKKIKVIAMADFVILNDGSLENLHKKIDDVLKKIS